MPARQVPNQVHSRSMSFDLNEAKTYFSGPIISASTSGLTTGSRAFGSRKIITLATIAVVPIIASAHQGGATNIALVVMPPQSINKADVLALRDTPRPCS